MRARHRQRRLFRHRKATEGCCCASVKPPPPLCAQPATNPTPLMRKILASFKRTMSVLLHRRNDAAHGADRRDLARRKKYDPRYFTSQTIDNVCGHDHTPGFGSRRSSSAAMIGDNFDNRSIEGSGRHHHGRKRLSHAAGCWPAIPRPARPITCRGAVSEEKFIADVDASTRAANLHLAATKASPARRQNLVREARREPASRPTATCSSTDSALGTTGQLIKRNSPRR